MKKTISLALLVLVITSASFAQKKRVAVVTFYANKYIGTSNLSGGGTIAAIGELAENPNFNLESVVTNFHSTFFNDYAKSFPFDIVPESEVLSNEQYKSYRSSDTTGSRLFRPLMINGYNKLIVGILYKKDLKKMAEIFDVDGFLFVNLSYEFAPKLGIGGMGSAGISAYADISLWTKDNNKVFRIYEYATSKKSVGMVAGVPIIKLEKILPMCEDASERLVKDLNKRLPKIVKKVSKKFS